MTLEQIRRMSDLVLGKTIAETQGWRLFKSQGVLMYDGYPNNKAFNRCDALATSLSAVFVVERIVIKKGLQSPYLTFLAEITCPNLYDGSGAPLTEQSGFDLPKLVLATARQRAEACLLALQET